MKSMTRSDDNLSCESSTLFYKDFDYELVWARSHNMTASWYSFNISTNTHILYFYKHDLMPEIMHGTNVKVIWRSTRYDMKHCQMPQGHLLPQIFSDMKSQTFYWASFLVYSLMHGLSLLKHFCSSFCRDYFQMHFLERIFLYKVVFKFYKSCSLGSNWLWDFSGLDNGLVPNRW